MSKAKILIVCEGEKTEPNIFKSIKDNFFATEAEDFFVCYYGSHLHNLIQKLEDASYDQLAEAELVFPIIKNILAEQSKNKKGKEAQSAKLASLTEEDISDIYFFFDLDAHDIHYSAERIKRLLNFFNESSEHGKLLISYPMAEALLDYTDTVDDITRTSKIKLGSEYKKISAQRSKLIPVTAHNTATTWHKLCLLNWMRAYTLIETKCDSLPSYKELLGIQQANIFQKQLKLHIEHKDEVLVLSAFPLFLLDYGFPADFLYDKVKALA